MVVPGVDGALTPSIQLEAAEIHCIGNTEPDNQALGIFGTLLLANHGQGDHTEKTISEISRKNGDFAISLSPAAFDQLNFVPSTEGVHWWYRNRSTLQRLSFACPTNVSQYGAFADVIWHMVGFQYQSDKILIDRMYE